jgi:hypothetical protein
VERLSLPAHVSELGNSNQFRIKEQGALLSLQQAGNGRDRGPLKLVSLSSKAWSSIPVTVRCRPGTHF